MTLIRADILIGLLNYQTVQKEEEREEKGSGMLQYSNQGMCNPNVQLGHHDCD